MRYDVQIPQGNMDDEKAEIVSEGKNQYVILSVDGQKVSLPFQVIDILHHEAEVVRYGDYVREMWAQDYEGELSDEKIREISESMLGYLTQCGDEYEIEELFSRLEEANEEKNAALREETSRRLKETNALHITGATLLSVEEAKQLNGDMLKASDNWWLRSPGDIARIAAFVYGVDGHVNVYGLYVTYAFGVRPALEITNLESSIYQIGDTLSFGDHSFTIISEKYALCDEIIEKRPFCNDYKKGNDYETSDIKVFVDNWFDRTKELETERTREDNLNKVRQEKINNLSGCEFICSLPQDWQKRIKDATINHLTDFYETTDLDKAVDGHLSIRALAEEAMNGRLTDLEDDFDWRDVLNGGDGYYGYCKARDEEEREI